MRSLFVCVAGLALGIGACGSVTANGDGANDVPTGPAIPVAGGPVDCTRSGMGIDVEVMPVMDTGAASQAVITASIPTGIDTTVAPCSSIAPSPAELLTQVSFTIKDGVLQASPTRNVEIVSQWFEWGEPMPGECAAAVVAVVNVTDGAMPTCGVTIRFGEYVDAPIGTYTVSAP